MVGVARTTVLCAVSCVEYKSTSTMTHIMITCSRSALIKLEVSERILPSAAGTQGLHLRICIRGLFAVLMTVGPLIVFTDIHYVVATRK